MWISGSCCFLKVYSHTITSIEGECEADRPAEEGGLVYFCIKFHHWPKGL